MIQDIHGFSGGINFSKRQARKESTKTKTEENVAFLRNSQCMLTDESSPVEKIVPDFLCGMKASFEQYLKNYGYSIMRDKNLQNQFFGLGVETINA